jgi:hypothetical protein
MRSAATTCTGPSPATHARPAPAGAILVAGLVELATGMPFQDIAGAWDSCADGSAA